MAPALNDLMYAYFGRQSSLADAAYAFYLAAYTAGVTGTNIVNLGYTGSGSPEGAVTAAVGAMYRDTTNGNLYLKTSGSGNTGWSLVAGSGSGATTSPIQAFLGTGSDGAVDFDGTNTFAFASTTGGAPNLVYTLTRDVYATNFTVEAGKTLNTGNFRILATGTVNVLGTVQCNGNNASGTNQATGGTVVAGGTIGLGGAGANGTTGAGVGGSGSITPFGSASVHNGGAGGAGGVAGATAGGANGPSIAFTAVQGGAQSVFYIQFAAAGQSTIRGAFQTMQGGVGGSGGGGDGTNQAGGGGGGGGVMVINCRTLTGNGTIQANGGNGGTPTTAVAGRAVGGGGGGGGGLIIVNTHTDSFSGTAQALGGTHGNFVNNGGSGGANGVDGGAGTVVRNVF